MLIYDEDSCPCSACVHRRHHPRRPKLRNGWVIGLQAVTMMAGLIYLALFEVPTLVAQLVTI